jgi:hypothetical protein
MIDVTTASIGNGNSFYRHVRSAITAIGSTTVQQLGNAIDNAITRIAIGNSSYQYNNWHTRPDGVQAKEEMPGAII